MPTPRFVPLTPPAGKTNNANAGSGTAAITLYLSVIFLLLAFFIMLQSVSPLQTERKAAVMKSIDQRFQIDPLLLMGDKPVTARADGLAQVQATLDSLGTLFSSSLELAKVARIDAGNTLLVTLPAESLFVAGGTAIKPKHGGLIDRVSRALIDHPAGLKMQALIATGPMGAEPGGTSSLAFTRAASLAAILINNGTPAASLAVGVEPGPSGRVRMLFVPGGDEPPASRTTPGSP